MFNEYDRVRLTRDVEVHYPNTSKTTKYRKGEEGFIVDISNGIDGRIGYCVEFDGFDKNGKYFSKYDFFGESDLELIHRIKNGKS